MSNEYRFIQKLGAEAWNEFCELYRSQRLDSEYGGLKYSEISMAFNTKDAIAKLCVYLVSKLNSANKADINGGLGDLTEKEIAMIRNMRGVRAGNKKPAYKNDITKDRLEAALKDCKYDKAKVAVKLGCSVGTVYNRMKEYGIPLSIHK